MKIKKILLFSTLFLLLFLKADVSAKDTDFFDEQMESSGASGLFDHLSDEQTELLEELGIDELSPDEFLDVSPRKVFDLFYLILLNEYKTPFTYMATVCVIVIATAIISQFLNESEKLSRIIVSFAVVCVSLCVIVPLGECISRVVSSVKMSADFMLALIPVLAAVLTVSGNPAAALSYNSLCFFAAQAVVSFSSDFIRPLIQTTLSLSVIGGFGDSVNFEKIVQFIKRLTMFLMSITSTVFITMLSLKGMLTSAADTVAVRGIRFMIGNLIPVVGGAISDAYTSIGGTLSLVKNTAAVSGIVAVALINLPVLIECVCWIFSLSLMAMISEMFSQNKIVSLIRSVSSCIVMMTVMLLFIVIVFVLSTGLVMLMKGG